MRILISLSRWLTDSEELEDEKDEEDFEEDDPVVEIDIDTTNNIPPAF